MRRSERNKLAQDQRARAKAGMIAATGANMDSDPHYMGFCKLLNLLSLLESLKVKIPDTDKLNRHNAQNYVTNRMTRSKDGDT